MEITGAIQHVTLYSNEQNFSKEKKYDELKGIMPPAVCQNAKVDIENKFSKFSSEENLYDSDFQKVAKDINDLNVPLSDSCGGMSGGSGGGG